MSLTEIATIPCPSCGATFEAGLHKSVNVTRDPALKEQLLRGELTTFACPKCSRHVRLVHPLLYADNARDFFVQLDPEGTLDPAAALGATPPPRKSRRVRDGNALLEKIKLEDAELDDRVVEVMKVLLQATHRDLAEVPWYFERAEGAEALLFTILSPKGVMATRRPREEYERVRADLEQRSALGEEAPFATIDRAYAVARLPSPA